MKHKYGCFRYYRSNLALKVPCFERFTKGTAMLQINEETLKNIESSTSRALVGESCKIIEEIEKQNLSSKDALSLIKSLLRNKIYESSRNHTNLIVKFSEGVSFNVTFERKPQA